MAAISASLHHELSARQTGATMYEGGREVFEELSRQILSFVDDPHREQILAIHLIEDAGLEVARELSAPIGGLNP